MRNRNNWLLLTASLAFSMVLGEVLVRTFLGDTIVLFPRYHEAATYDEFTIRRLRPETEFWHTSIDGSWRFVINKQGFRSTVDFSHESRPGVLRIIALGDSHTMGFEARQNRAYPAIIEQYLDLRGFDAEVINAAVSGFGTAEQAMFLEGEALKYDPDVIVLGFFANDFEDNVKSDLFRLEDGRLIVHNTSHTPGISVLRLHNAIAPLRWLSENSYLYSVALNSAWDGAKALLLSRKRAEVGTEVAIATRAPRDYEKRLAVQLIAKMYQICKQHEIPFIIVDIPQNNAPGEFESSLPADLISGFERNSDVLIKSEALLSPYRSLTEIHVPHGQTHISEFTHLMIGVEVARKIAAWRGRMATTPDARPGARLGPATGRCAARAHDPAACPTGEHRQTEQRS